STLNEFLGDKYNRASKLDGRYYRFLAKYREMNSFISGLEQEIQNKQIKERKYISNNEMGTIRKKKLLCKNPSKYMGGHKRTMNYKYNIFETKKYSYLEKKIFKELDYENFLKNSKTISNKIYKKIMIRKYGLRIATPLILLLLLTMSLILDITCNMGLIKGWYEVLNLLPIGKWYMHLDKLLRNSPIKQFFQSMKELKNVLIYKGRTDKSSGYIYVSSFLGLFIYVIPFIILGITVISGVVYYHKKVKKYEKIKFTKR
ncbi:Plasmodium exported protein (Pm-fam-a like), unknown function, partial [Plasmodium malariae]